jgi:Fur family ferric uptake transcriptional regulator
MVPRAGCGWKQRERRSVADSFSGQGRVPRVLKVRITLSIVDVVANERPSLPPRARVTPQREAVLEAIGATRGSFTVATLYDRARAIEPRLGLATVYRTVELLRRSGAVRPLAGEGRPAYVRCRPGHHHHLVCLACGAVEETELCAAPPAAELKRRYGFAAEAHEVDVYGTCARCAA